jgi:molecular chaperone HtpG
VDRSDAVRSRVIRGQERFTGSDAIWQHEIVRLQESALYRWLKTERFEYAAKALELRDEAERWLSYIPQSFPHYTLHTIRHSEEIVRQISNLLFDDRSDRPILETLSPTEAYIMIASAILHDSGMVVSDDERSKTVTDSRFQDWLRSNPERFGRWQEIEDFRNRKSIPKDQANFLADVQVRYVLAEYFRGQHHLRSSSIVTQHEATLGRLAFGDLALTRAIAKACAGHGLRHEQLEDESEYPDSRDIRGDKVSIRFVTLMLRLGDLLDVSQDRACPLLLNAACPLPPESYAHWTQYKDIEKDISPEKIQIIGRCADPESHRVLRDWCQWIADEVSNARSLMSHTKRHSEWRPPKATIGAEDASIQVIRAPGARYIPEDWRFELDQDLVFERLIRDAYPGRRFFVKELLQNAVDATRCRLTMARTTTGGNAPIDLLDTDPTIRHAMPLKVGVRKQEVPNPMSGGKDPCWIVSVEDNGIGMTRETIKKHLLQIGRSYYRSDEFRERFAFTPISRFGVGFLTVFAESSDVTVETKSFGDKSPAVRMRLSGVKKYILVEESDRSVAGTKVEVSLREPVEAGWLTSQIRSLCANLEFPVEVEDFGTKTLIEPRAHFVGTRSLALKGALSLREIGFRVPNARGSFYFHFTTSKDGSEDWAWSESRRAELRAAMPGVEIRPLPRSEVLLQGLRSERLRSEGFETGSNLAFSIDLRGPSVSPTLSRDGLLGGSATPLQSETMQPFMEVLDKHILEKNKIRRETDWRYLNRLAEALPESTHSRLAFLPCWDGKKTRARHVNELNTHDSIWILLDEALTEDEARSARQDARIPANAMCLRSSELAECHEAFIRAVLWGSRYPTAVMLKNGVCVLRLAKGAARAELRRTSEYDKIIKADLPPGFVAMEITLGDTYDSALLVNTESPLIRWVLSLSGANANQEDIELLWQLVVDAAKYSSSSLGKLKNLLLSWSNSKAISKKQRPPQVDLAGLMSIGTGGALIEVSEENRAAFEQLEKCIQERFVVHLRRRVPTSPSEQAALVNEKPSGARAARKSKDSKRAKHGKSRGSSVRRNFSPARE